MARGILRIYLGAAPGVGKTFAMLDEGWRRHQRGTDVVVGYVETHGRPKTAAQLRDLEVVPRRRLRYRGTELEEMDLDTLLARRPEVVLVDELAHTNVPGSTHEKRWQDVEALLDAGVEVISTVNVQHLESLNDVIERITGVVQRETVPDAVVRRADQIELVDMSPEALRRRMAHGNIYPAERVDAALANYFRPGNLGALRELALLWVADQVEGSLHDYLAAHGITETWETRERVVVALDGQPGRLHVIRRAARLAGRARGELLGVHVLRDDGLASGPVAALVEQRTLLGELEGQYHEVAGDDVGRTLVEFAEAEQATQLVLGDSRHRGLTSRLRRSTVGTALAHARGIDLHVIAGDGGDDAAGSGPTTGGPGPHPAGRRPGGQWSRRATPLTPARHLAGAALTLVGLPVLVALLATQRGTLGLSALLLVCLAAVVLVAAVGGLVTGLVAAVGTSVLANWFLVPPVHTLTIAQSENVIALVVFVAVAGTVSTLVDVAARRTGDASRSRAEAAALARATATLVADLDPLPRLVAHLRSTFMLAAVAVLERVDGEGWGVAVGDGAQLPRTPDDGIAIGLDRDGDRVLVLVGGHLSADDLRVVRVMADQLAVALERRRLQADAAAADALAETDALRTALLQAVSHDLRTPLASIKASVTTLLQDDVDWSADDQQALLDNIDVAADRLDRLVANLLDMSRLQSGAMHLACRPTALEDVVANALTTTSAAERRVVIEVPETVPLVLADPALLERAVANIVSNALVWSPPERPVRIEAGRVGERVDLRIADQGPGVPRADRSRIFEPFQRLGDRSSDAGVGLGLAVAKGFVEAMGATLDVDDTPGGGLTLTIGLPVAPTP